MLSPNTCKQWPGTSSSDLPSAAVSVRGSNRLLSPSRPSHTGLPKGFSSGNIEVYTSASPKLSSLSKGVHCVQTFPIEKYPVKLDHLAAAFGLWKDRAQCTRMCACKQKGRENPRPRHLPLPLGLLCLQEFLLGFLPPPPPPHTLSIAFKGLRETLAALPPPCSLGPQAGSFTRSSRESAAASAPPLFPSFSREGACMPV